MKICIIIGAFLPVPPVEGGAVEKLWYQLAKEFVAKGHDVLMISKLWPLLHSFERTNHIEHRRVKGYPAVSSGLQLKILDLLYTRRACRVIPEDADVIVTNTFWAPIIINRRLKRRVYVDVARMPKGQMICYLGVGRLRANSSPVATAIQNELPKKYHHCVVTIPNPLPFTPGSSIEFPEKREAMLYVGRVHPEKGLHVLISAIRKSKRRIPLRIVGPWEIQNGGGGQKYLDELRVLAKNLDIDFVGPIFDIDKLNYEYARASIFVYPSFAERGETFGLAPLEAMAWGCVPIVSDLACFKDFIHHEINGLIFDHRALDPINSLANSLNSILDDTKKIKLLSNNSLKIRETHSPQKIAEKFLLDFYKLQNLNKEK